jgi:nicotinamide-nucleotide amidase
LKAALLLVGNEILAGFVRDANIVLAARALVPRGCPLTRVEGVGDDVDEIAAGVGRLAAVADLLVVTGGLGPTEDDVTRAALARALDTELVLDERALAQILARAEARGLPTPERVRWQAEFPRGTESVPNPVGSAPGIRCRIGDCDVWVLPGVPAEVEAMLPGLLATLPEPAAGISYERLVATAGLNEVFVAERVQGSGFRPPAGVQLAYLPSPAGVRLRLAAPHGVAGAVLDRAAAELRTALAPHDLPTSTPAEALVQESTRSGTTLASAESCTGGMIGARITDVPGSSAVYLGGVIAYANRVKSERLGVAPELLERHGAVSEETVRAMARGCRERFGSDLALAVTGVAGPGGGTPQNPVGSVWLAVADEEAIVAQRRSFPGGRETVRERTVNAALVMAYRRIRGILE